MTRDSFSFRWHGVVGIKPAGDADRPCESGGGRWLDPGNTIRGGEPASLGGDHAIIAPHPCMRWDPVGSRTMMQLYASVAKLRSSGSPFFYSAEAIVGDERPLPRIVYGDRRSKAPARRNLLLCSPLVGSDGAISYAAGLSLKPSGTTPVLT